MSTWSPGQTYLDLGSVTKGKLIHSWNFWCGLAALFTLTLGVCKLALKVSGRPALLQEAAPGVIGLVVLAVWSLTRAVLAVRMAREPGASEERHVEAQWKFRRFFRVTCLCASVLWAMIAFLD